jgi:hypothetical protein
MNNRQFDEAARMLSRSPREWLIPMLAFWSRLIGYRKLRPSDDVDTRKMIEAAGYLEDQTVDVGGALPASFGDCAGRWRAVAAGEAEGPNRWANSRAARAAVEGDRGEQGPACCGPEAARGGGGAETALKGKSRQS